MTEQMLTVDQVAQLTGLSRRSVYRAVDDGELVAYRPRGRVRIPETAVDAWLETHRVAPRSRPQPAGPRGGASAPSEVRRILLPEEPGETPPR